MSTSARNALRRFVVFTPLVASIWVLFFYAFCLRVYWALGRLPTNKHDRLQANLEHGLHDWIVACGLIGLISLFVPWLIAFVVVLAEKVVGPRLACLLPLGWAPMALVFCIDPGHWFWDVYFD